MRTLACALLLSMALAAQQSHICVIDRDGKNETVVLSTPRHFEAQLVARR